MLKEKSILIVTGCRMQYQLLEQIGIYNYTNFSQMVTYAVTHINLKYWRKRWNVINKTNPFGLSSDKPNKQGVVVIIKNEFHL